jgi:DNA-binding GntR family transcriptional regulator
MARGALALRRVPGAARRARSAGPGRRRAPGAARAASLTQRIVNQLEEDILSGALRPGERLVEESLSARFGTSRTPVREVLRLLEAKGLVTTRVSRGAQVRETSWKEIEDLYAVRGVLERMAMELASRNLNQAYLKRLEGKLRRMRDAARRGDVRGYFDVDNEFRALIFGACGNEVLIELLRNLERRVQTLRFALLSLPNRLPESHRHHEAVLGALKRRDGKLAGEIRRRRIDSSKALLGRFFRTLGRGEWGAPPEGAAAP